MKSSPDFDINCGAAISASTFAVAISNMDLDDPFSILITYSEDSKQPWSRYEYEDIICEICFARRATNDAHDFAALTQEGAVLLVNGSFAREAIPGAGVWSEDADGSGALSTITTVGDMLFAGGDSGQVFRRIGRDHWEELARSRPGDENSLADITSIAKVGPRTYLCGGIAHAEFEVTAEMEAAEEAGDFEHYQQLVVDLPGDAGMLWKYSGEWHKVEVPTDSAPVAIELVDDCIFVAYRDGFVARTSDLEAFELSDALDVADRGEVVGMVRYGTTVLVATELDLFSLEFPDLNQFAPHVPATVERICGISVAGDKIWIFDAEGVYRLDDGKWNQIPIPDELTKRSFSGLSGR